MLCTAHSSILPPWHSKVTVKWGGGIKYATFAYKKKRYKSTNLYEPVRSSFWLLTSGSLRTAQNHRLFAALTSEVSQVRYGRELENK
jgi:hypothetical protein